MFHSTISVGTALQNWTLSVCVYVCVYVRAQVRATGEHSFRGCDVTIVSACHACQLRAVADDRPPLLSPLYV